MCAPGNKQVAMAATTESSVQPQSPSSSNQHKQHNGFFLGTVSLALTVTAGTVTMGHLQARRDQLGCDALCVGSMTSARSSLTLLGSTLMGMASDTGRLDRFGGARKILMGIGILASALEIVFGYRATSLSMLWMSMVPGALLQQNFNILKALFGEYHEASATAAERAGSVGKLGMAAGLAFMLGPLMSSTLLDSYEQAAGVALICLALSLAVILRMPRQQRRNKTSPLKEPQLAPVGTPEKSFLTPAAIFLTVSRICMALAFHVFQTIWTVALRERFHFGPKDYGRYFGFIGFCFALSQGFLAKALLQRFGKSDRGRTRLLLMCALMLGGGRMLAYQTESIAVVYTLFAGIVTALGIVNTIFTADTSKIADPQELGGLFGVLGSMESLAGIMGPILGGGLAKIHPVNGPLVAVVTLYGIVFSLVYWGYERIVIGQHRQRAGSKKDD